MKKIICLILTLSFIISLAGCKGQNGEGSSSLSDNASDKISAAQSELTSSSFIKDTENTSAIQTSETSQQHTENTDTTSQSEKKPDITERVTENTTVSKTQISKPIMEKDSNVENKDIEAVHPKREKGYENLKQWESENPLEDNFLKSLNNFSYKTASDILTSSNSNVNYSPISLYFALSLVASGSGGGTQKEMLSVLDMNNTADMSTQSGNLYRRLYNDEDDRRLLINNSLWFNTDAAAADIRFIKSFEENAVKNYYASVFRESFSNTETADKMTNWVSKNTNNLLNPEFELSSEILTIINTIYFKSCWANQFSTQNNTTEDFTLQDNSKIKTDFMNQTLNSDYYKGKDYIITSLKMENGEMELVLPNEGVTARSLINTPEKMNSIFGSNKDLWRKASIKLMLPKFSFKSDFDLVPYLKKLGLKSAFNSETADFSGITENAGTYIDKIIQGTFIEVAEEGVEAAGYTMITMKNSSIQIDLENITMNFDRPFIYCIKDSNGVPLFIGTVDNPAASK